MVKEIMYILLSLFLASFLTPFCIGTNGNTVTLSDNNKIYPWIVEISNSNREGDFKYYGTLITHNAVLAEFACALSSGLMSNATIVKSYCQTTSNGKQTGDCISSEISTYFRQDFPEIVEIKEQPIFILILKKSFYGNFINPIELASPNSINENDCFLTIWSSTIPLPQYNIDLNKSAHRVNIRYRHPSDIKIKTEDFNKDVLNAVLKPDYYNLIRSSSYSDHYISKMAGSAIVCSLQQNPKEYVLAGVSPGYLLPICHNENECVKAILFINLMNQQNEIMKKVTENIIENTENTT